MHGEISDNIIPIFCLEGIDIQVKIDEKMKPAIYLWRQYNKFDDVPTLIPNGFIRSVYNDQCDNCTELVSYCSGCITRHQKWLENNRFGSKILAKDYTPVKIEHPGFNILFIHDNGDRPFKVYYKSTINPNEKNKIYVYCRRRNLIYGDDDDKDYTTTHIVEFAESTTVKPIIGNNYYDNNEDDNNEDNNDNNDIKYEQHQETINISDEKYYDELVYEGEPVDIFVPEGYYVRDWNEEESRIRISIDDFFKGNTLLLFNGMNKEGDYEYTNICEKITSFSTPDKILKYYSLIGNNDVPYPIMVGKKYVHMLECGSAPIEVFSKFTELQMLDASSYFYGHLCPKCHIGNCGHESSCCSEFGISNQLVNKQVLVERLW